MLLPSNITKLLKHHSTRHFEKLQIIHYSLKTQDILSKVKSPIKKQYTQDAKKLKPNQQKNDITPPQLQQNVY